MTKKMIYAFMAFFLIFTDAFAVTRVLRIPFNGQVFNGSSTIYLKREIQRRYPGVNLQRSDLLRVVLVAKSARGGGRAYLQVGGFTSRTEQVDGNIFNFNNHSDYYQIPFISPRRDRGVWQLHLRGRIKVRAVRVVIDTDRFGGGGGPGVFVTRSCTYVMETIWGADIRDFYATASGIRGSGVEARACAEAQRKCLREARRRPLLVCNKK